MAERTILGINLDRFAKAQIVVRFYELFLVLLGLVIIFSEDRETQAVALVIWSSGAIAYLIVGILVVRRIGLLTDARPDTNSADPPHTHGLTAHLAAQRFTAIFAFAMSLTGMAAAVEVIIYRNDKELGNLFEAFGIVAMLCAWMLLHAGYARIYLQLFYRGQPGGGLQFPQCDHPGIVEFIYFSYTLGATFAVSDVSVTTRQMRWHVTVHSVVSFFYNSAVLGLAVSIVIGN